MSGSFQSATQLEHLINRALAAIDVPPSLSARAQQNLKALAGAEGIEAVRDRVESAEARKQRAALWLSSRRARQIDANGAIETADAGQSHALWTEIESIARNKLATREWAKHFLEASSVVSRHRGLKTLKYIEPAKAVCINLLRATEADDFRQEPAVIRGSVFAETANIFSTCAMLAHSQDVMEESLVFYGNAVKALSQVKDPRAGMLVAIVQVNRGSALDSFGRIMSEKLHRFRSDITDVQAYLSGASEVTCQVYENLAIDIDVIQDSLRALAEFDDSFRARTGPTNWTQPPIDTILDAETSALFGELTR